MRTWKWVLVLTAPALWVAAARPADRLVPPERTTVELLLLRQKSVQQELKLSPEIAKKVVEFTSKQSEAFKAALKLGDEERKQKLMDMEKENKQFLADNLTEGQRKRLLQITLQVTGLHELNRPEVAKALNLTEEQQQKFKDLQKEHRKQLEEIIQPKEREGRNEKLAKLREDTRNEIRAILTDGWCLPTVERRGGSTTRPGTKRDPLNRRPSPASAAATAPGRLESGACGPASRSCS
jgi:hypothetical protein